MTITNHILAGSLIGLTVVNPALAVILALASHFVMDVLPHFGYAGRKGYSEALKHKLSYVVAVATLITSLGVLLFLALHGEWFAIFTGLVAASPDVVGLYNWLGYEKHGRKASGWLEIVHVKFHRAIQWCERPWGVWVELMIFVVLSYILTGIIKT